MALGKQINYYGLQDVKDNAYESVLKRKELQRERDKVCKLISHKQHRYVKKMFFVFASICLSRSLPIAWPTEVEDILDTMATFAPAFL